MAEVEDEAQLPLDTLGERSGQRGFEFDGCAAVIAHEMGVHVAGEVVLRRAVAEMDVGHDAQLGEQLHRAIDAGRTHVRVIDGDASMELLGGGVRAGVEQCPQHHPTGRSDPNTTGTEPLHQLVDAPVGHGRTVPSGGAVARRSAASESQLRAGCNWTMPSLPSPTVTLTSLTRALRRLLCGLVPLMLVLAACGSDDEPDAAPDPAGDDDSTDDGSGDDSDEDRTADALRVVTTVSPITSIAANVIGDLATIEGVVPEGTNSHTFEPPPSVSEILDGADVVFLNGLQLEEPTLELARTVAADAEIVLIGDEVVSPDEYLFDFSFPEDEGKPNPHLWTDPTLAIAYAQVIAETMAEVDADHADEYRANADAFEVIMLDFEEKMVEALDTVPEENRKLLTYHDAYAYWAQNYDWEVIGAIQPEDFGDPTPREVADLIEQVEDSGVPAIFGSEVFPSPVLEQIANETGVDYVDDLRDDDLPGEPGDADHSYVGLMKFDYVTMVEALGGDPAALEAFEVRDVDEDLASYPQ